MGIFTTQAKIADRHPSASGESGGAACRLRVPVAIWDGLTEWLRASEQERFAYLLGRASAVDDPWGRRTVDVWVRRAVPVPDQALVIQSPVRVEVDPTFSAAVLQACWEGGLSLIDVHTHPFADASVGFSGHDRNNMLHTHAEFAASIPTDPPAVAASLVLGRRSAAGTWLVPGTNRLEPLHSLHIIGTHDEEIPLCES